MKVQQAVFTLTFVKFRFFDLISQDIKKLGCVHNLASNLFLYNKMNIASYCKNKKRKTATHAKWRGAHRQSKLYMY